MSQPTAYNRETDFTDRDGDDTDHEGINTELDKAATSINQIRTNLALVQRDDGGLANQVVTADALHPSAIALLQGEAATAADEAQAAAAQAVLAATTANTARDATIVARDQALTASNAAALNAQVAVDAAASINPASFATAAQGEKADTALQPGQAATTAQGAKADSALQEAAIGVSIQAFDGATAKTNQAQQYTAPQRTDPLTDNDLSFDISAKQDFLCTPTAGGTLTFTGIAAGRKGEILLVNSGAYTIAKAAAVKCPSSMLAAISATGRYRLAYSCLDGTNVDVTASGALA